MSEVPTFRKGLMYKTVPFKYRLFHSQIWRLEKSQALFSSDSATKQGVGVKTMFDEPTSMLDTIIETVLGIIVAVVLYVPINQTVATSLENATGIASVVLPLIPAFYALGIAILAISFVRARTHKGK